MKIIVKVQDLIDKTENSLATYEEDYKKLIQLYKQKVVAHCEYVVRKIDSGKKAENLKGAPYPPTYMKSNYEKSLAALKAHTEPTVTMDDKEYSDILAGLERIRESVTSSTYSLNSLSY